MQALKLNIEVENSWIDNYSNHQPHFVVKDQTTEGLLINCDCFSWLSSLPDNSIDAIVTDPPYGVKEYQTDQIEKRNNGYGGIWRIPPSFDGSTRSPLPRFTALNKSERESLSVFFKYFGYLISKKLKPGGHVFLASNSFLSQLVFSSVINDQLEFRTEIIRIVRTLRGGDRPKNYENEFPDVCSLPRGCYEPWGLFRKKLLENMKVGDCLREYGTGALRRISDIKPFEDVITSNRTSREEKKISDHPSLKPQEFLRKIVYASLPLGSGIVVDPFMGSGSTISAAMFLNYRSVGVEISKDYFDKAKLSVPLLKTIK